MQSNKIIYTIGHSTRDLDIFIKILHASNIELLIDVRSFPGSRKFPHFSKNNLATILPDKKISYIHELNLGGRKTPSKTTKHIAIKVAAFSAYGDYMETDTFKQAALKLEEIASKQNVAYMCSESCWFKCHRRMISDWLSFRGWNVLHIGMGNTPYKHVIWDIARLDDLNIMYIGNTKKLIKDDISEKIINPKKILILKKSCSISLETHGIKEEMSEKNINMKKILILKKDISLNF
jgi:uncharacterized protein (DUF488 family)